MTKNDFLAKIVEILDSTEEVTFETTLSDIEEWDSITVISVAAFLDSLGKKVPQGVFHAFSGSYETYERIAKYGNFMVGIGGVVTYKNAGVAKSVERIPLERIVLETDSPYLTPVPFRGKRNESSYLVHIAEKIAQIKGIALEEVASTTTHNAFEMFGL